MILLVFVHLGTCIGEIPPYWMARASRLAVIEAGEKGESKGDIPEELEVNSQYWIINKVKGKYHNIEDYSQCILLSMHYVISSQNDIVPAFLRIFGYFPDGRVAEFCFRLVWDMLWTFPHAFLVRANVNMLIYYLKHFFL